MLRAGLSRTLRPTQFMRMVSFDLGGEGRPVKKPKALTIPAHRYGVEIMYDPVFNKGTAYTDRERDRLGLRGLVPPVHFSIDEQVERVYKSFHQAGHTSAEAVSSGQKEDLAAKYNFMCSLQDRNETLFYRLVTEKIEEMAPIIYTPTVGYACQNSSMLFRRPRGMYFTANDRNDMHAIVQNWPRSEVDVVVVTDGSRILGLGDLGVQGMAIPIGKLSLYVAAGGIEPTKCLPVMIDVGTNNKKLLNDRFYMGLKHERIEGQEYFEILDEFISAITTRFPRALIQFEDFKTPKAEQLLNRYRNVACCFNDDMQGTGAVALAGLLAALRRTGDSLKRSRIVCVGAGSAGLGVCNMLVDALIREGLSRQEALTKFYLVDEHGLLTANRREKLMDGQTPFARYDAESLENDRAPLLQVVDKFKPTILLGLSGVGGLFNEDVVRTMANHTKLPIIFAMSNPTHLSECTAEQAVQWTDGRVIFASGSPFEPVKRTAADGTTSTQYISQANNMFIFPGVGLGVVASQAKMVSDRMFYVAARRLAECVSDQDLAAGKVFPPIKDIRSVSQRVAVAVATVAQEDGLARTWPDDRNWSTYIQERMWYPDYAPLIRGSSPVY